MSRLKGPDSLLNQVVNPKSRGPGSGFIGCVSGDAAPAGVEGRCSSSTSSDPAHILFLFLSNLMFILNLLILIYRIIYWTLIS